MTTPPDGGPAFPCGPENSDHPGMSLRDFFAGQAIAGLGLTDEETDSWGGVAAYAYGLADAMLKERRDG